MRNLRSIPFLVLGIFILLDVVMIVLYHNVGGEMYDLDWEENLPTLYQALKLMIAMLAAIALYFQAKSRTEKFSWGFMAVMFGYLGLDEWFQIHEEISRITDEILLDTIGRVSFSAWILPFIPVFIIGLGVMYWIFMNVIRKSEFRKHRVDWWFGISALVLASIPIIEVLSTIGWDFEGQANVWWITLEEGMEMLGISLFVGLLAYVYYIQRSKSLPSKSEVGS